MKQKITYLFIVLFFIACTSPVKEVVLESYPNKQVKEMNLVQEVGGKEVVVGFKTFFENGQLKMGGELLKGKRDGKWVAFFENGQLQSEGTFDEGVRTGKVEVYFSNGNLMYEGTYKEDKETGVWKFYNEAGKFIKEKDFN